MMSDVIFYTIKKLHLHVKNGNDDEDEASLCKDEASLCKDEASLYED